MLYGENCLEIRLYRDAALSIFEFINDFVQVLFLNEAYLGIDDQYWTEKSSIIKKFHKLHLIFNEELDFEHRSVCWAIKTFCVGKEIVVVPAHTASFKTYFAQAIQVLRCSSIEFKGFSEEDAAGVESMRKRARLWKGSLNTAILRNELSTSNQGFRTSTELVIQTASLMIRTKFVWHQFRRSQKLSSI